MITAGDERGRTQGGNNNAYCQDNEISWVDWRPDDAWLDLYEITKTALRLRREHPALRQRHFLEGRPDRRGRPQGPGLDPPRRPRDDRLRLVRREPAHLRHVRLRRPAARAAALVARCCTTRRSCCGSTPTPSRARRRLPANEWVLVRRGGAQHRPRPSRRRASSARRRHRHRAALDDRAPRPLTRASPQRRGFGQCEGLRRGRRGAVRGARGVPGVRGASGTQTYADSAVPRLGRADPRLDLPGHARPTQARVSAGQEGG